MLLENLTACDELYHAPGVCQGVSDGVSPVRITGTVYTMTIQPGHAAHSAYARRWVREIVSVEIQNSFTLN